MVSLFSSSSSSHSSSSSGRHHSNQRFGGPGFHEPMLPPPDLETAAPHGHPAHRSHSPPPPHRHGHRSHHFGRPAFLESMFSPPPAYESSVPHLFMSCNHSPPRPPPSLGHHHHPPPPSHGHPQQFGGPAFHEPMLSSRPAPEYAAPQSPPPPPHLDYHNYSHSPTSPPPHLDYHDYLHSPPSPPPHHGHGPHHPHQLGRSSALEIEEPHLFMENSLLPPPHLDYHNYLDSPPSPPHRHGQRHPHQLGRRFPALETEVPHLFMDHLYCSHCPPPPPPPPQGHQNHSSPFHGFQHHAAKLQMQPPMGPSKETRQQYEPFMSGMGLHPPMSNMLPREEGHPPPHQEMGGGQYDHFGFQGGHSYMPYEMEMEMGGAHPLRHPPLHPRSPPPKNRGRPVARPSYPPSCAPLVPAAHLSNAHRAVPVC